MTERVDPAAVKELIGALAQAGWHESVVILIALLDELDATRASNARQATLIEAQRKVIEAADAYMDHQCVVTGELYDAARAALAAIEQERREDAKG